MRRCSFFSFPLRLVAIVVVHLWTVEVRVRGEVASGGVLQPDLPALLSFKAYNPNATALATWTGADPCCGSWFGIKCSRAGRVAGVYLDGASLVGDVAPLLRLGRVRTLAVRNNSLSGALPPLNDADDSTSSPRLLRHLLVSRNRLRGSLNVSLGALLTLRAERNGFTGGLEALRAPMLRNFNVSGNKLVGEISGELARFPSSAFGDNLALCGQPLPRCVRAYNNAVGDGGYSNVTTTAAQSPSPAPNGGFGNKLSSVSALMATGIANAVLITVSLTISVAMFVYVRRKLRSAKDASSDAALCFEEEDKQRTTDGDVKCQTKSGSGLVCFEGGEVLRLESLLKASAEVLGKGVSGSTYKAVLDDGVVVAVKRLSALQFPASRSKAFDRHMRLVGRLRHRHVVSLRGYCNSNGERLLVYDYLPNGSLQSVLQGHGGGAGTRSLDWAARKSVLFGVAQGLNYIHTFPARPALVHANVKPSNILLLDERGGACVSECGLMRYATNAHHHHQSVVPQALHRRPPELFLDGGWSSAASSGGWRGSYAAPELASSTRATQESDVYSFGAVLLEVVTGGHKAGDGGEERDDGGDSETTGWIKIGTLCTAEAPEERPTMAQVLAMIREFM